jgi:hypothetical protein
MNAFLAANRIRLSLASLTLGIVLALGASVWMAAQATKPQMTVYK